MARIRVLIMVVVLRMCGIVNENGDVYIFWVAVVRVI